MTSRNFTPTIAVCIPAEVHGVLHIKVGGSLDISLSFQQVFTLSKPASSSSLSTIMLFVYASLLAAVALPMASAKSDSIFSFNTFGESSESPMAAPICDKAHRYPIGCVGFQENVDITQAGTNENNFGGPRESFSVIESDGTCTVTLFSGDNQSGSSFDFGSLPNGECFGLIDGNGNQLAANSFDVQCS